MAPFPALEPLDGLLFSFDQRRGLFAGHRRCASHARSTSIAFGSGRALNRRANLMRAALMSAKTGNLEYASSNKGQRSMYGCSVSVTRALVFYFSRRVAFWPETGRPKLARLPAALPAL